MDTDEHGLQTNEKCRMKNEKFPKTVGSVSSFIILPSSFSKFVSIRIHPSLLIVFLSRI